MAVLLLMVSNHPCTECLLPGNAQDAGAGAVPSLPNSLELYQHYLDPAALPGHTSTPAHIMQSCLSAAACLTPVCLEHRPANSQHQTWCITAGDAAHIAWAAQGNDILDPFTEGHYLNMNKFDAPESVETCFPADNWARLVQVKAKYDPHSLFRPLDYYRTDEGTSGIAGASDY